MQLIHTKRFRSLWHFAVSLLLRYTAASTPVVGVFSEPFCHQHVELSVCRRKNTTSCPQHSFTCNGNYIAASYQKWLEVAGLRSIPIPYDAPQELLDAIFDEINGLFLPGGGSTMNHAVSYMIDKAYQSNTQDNTGVYFPVWGTCLGMEHLVEYFGGRNALEDDYDAENMTLPLFQVDGASSQLYNDSAIYNMVTTLPITLNNHHSGITPSTFRNNAMLDSLFLMTSTNVDANHKPFVSTMEPRHSQRFPFYGVQYHPEKNLFEYGSYNNSNRAFEAISHSAEARYFSFHLAQVWGRLVQYGYEQQQQQQQEQRHRHQYTGRFPVLSSYPTLAGIGFEQVYLIPSADEIMSTIAVNVAR